MFSHVLVSYMSELRQFSQKTTGTFETISKALEQKPKYDFCVLKELTQHEGSEALSEANSKITSLDEDQSLFFAVSLRVVILCEINNEFSGPLSLLLKLGTIVTLNASF